MKINKITGIGYTNNICASAKTFNKSSYQSKDNITFRGPATTLTVLVAKEGYNTLKNVGPKAKFANELYYDICFPDTTKNARSVVNTLFALAKSLPKDEPRGEIYNSARLLTERVSDSYNIRLSSMRLEALEKLFPLVPEMNGDVNSGHAAKVALLSSMIDTGEYVNSPAFYTAFTELSSLYLDDKVFLVKKILKDANVYRNAVALRADEMADSHYYSQEYQLPPKSFWKSRYIQKNRKTIFPEIDKQIKMTNIALLMSLNPNECRSLFLDYEDSIQAQAQIAFKAIKDKLTSERDSFYTSYIGQYTSGLFYSESFLGKTYFFDMMNHLGNDREAIAKEFNISEDYAEDLYKDFVLIQNTKNLTDEEEVNQLYQQRIKEKEQTEDSVIIKSIPGLLRLSDNSLKELKEKYPMPFSWSSLDYGNDTDDLESWELADLQTPWIVR